MSKNIAIGVILFVLGLIVGRASVIATGSGSTASPSPASPAAPMMAMPAAPSRPAPSTAATGETLRGRVAEVIQVSQYTYLRLETGEWAVVSSVPTLAVGQEVGVVLQNEMVEFASPSFRTFARLWFGTLEGAEPVAAHPNGAPAMPAPTAVPAAPEVKAALKTVPSGPALTLRIQDIYSEKAMLGGQRVKVKATVDRVSFVQNVYYVHLKDGTGAAADKSDELLATSTVEVKKGDAVVMEGTVVLNKDVGMGPVPVSLDQAQPR